MIFVIYRPPCEDMPPCDIDDFGSSPPNQAGSKNLDEALLPKVSSIKIGSNGIPPPANGVNGGGSSNGQFQSNSLPQTACPPGRNNSRSQSFTQHQSANGPQILGVPQQNRLSGGGGTPPYSSQKRPPVHRNIGGSMNQAVSGQFSPYPVPPQNVSWSQQNYVIGTAAPCPSHGYQVHSMQQPPNNAQWNPNVPFNNANYGNTAHPHEYDKGGFSNSMVSSGFYHTSQPLTNDFNNISMRGDGGGREHVCNNGNRRTPSVNGRIRQGH